VWRTISIGLLAGLAVQWGTAGSSIVIAYFTIPKGIGCYSIFYFAYARISTVILFSLLLSVILSHAAMLRHQKHRLALEKYSSTTSASVIDIVPTSRQSIGHPCPDDESELQNQTAEPLPQSNRPPQRPLALRILGPAAVTTRYFGKTLAIINSFGLVVSSVLQLSESVFSTCWCQAAVFTWEDKAWVPIFMTAREFRAASQAAWAGGVIMSIGVCTVAPLLIWLWARIERNS
jgi:hypothetical protein